MSNQTCGVSASILLLYLSCLLWLFFLFFSSSPSKDCKIGLVRSLSRRVLHAYYLADRLSVCQLLAPQDSGFGGGEGAVGILPSCRCCMLWFCIRNGFCQRMAPETHPRDSCFLMQIIISHFQMQCSVFFFFCYISIKLFTQFDASAQVVQPPTYRHTNSHSELLNNGDRRWGGGWITLHPKDPIQNQYWVKWHNANDTQIQPTP